MYSYSELKDFHYDSKNVRCFLGIRFDQDRFEAFMSGFCVTARFQIYPERMVMEDPYVHACIPTRENHPMVLRAEIVHSQKLIFHREMKAEVGKRFVRSRL